VPTSVVARHIVANRTVYQIVEGATKVPWFVVGIIHALESDLNFKTHLFNGDPLTHRTVNQPVDQPRDGVPPFQWEFAAIRALQYDHLDAWTQWDVPGICFALERYNGFGYRARHIHSPYLWGGSQHYARGKFVCDGRFDPDAQSDQIGGAVILKYLTSAQWVALPSAIIPQS
jgi:lysozyme family protein